MTTQEQDTFTAEERAAMKERAAELKSARRRGSGSRKTAADEADALAKIAEMPEADRVIAEMLHAIVKVSRHADADPDRPTVAIPPAQAA